MPIETILAQGKITLSENQKLLLEFYKKRKQIKSTDKRTMWPANPQSYNYEKSDLVAGNWVNYLGSPNRVESIISFKFYHAVLFNFCWNGTQVLECDDVKPIPIIAAHLDQAGFTKISSNQYLLSLTDKAGEAAEAKITITDCNATFMLTNANGQRQYSRSLKYIHRLQNEYFDITGIRLEIEL